MIRFSAFSIFLSALFVGISTTGAHAYLDGGTGSMLLQLILGGAAGLAIAGKLYWYRFLTFIGVKSKTDIKEERRKSREAEARAER